MYVGFVGRRPAPESLDHLKSGLSSSASYAAEGVSAGPSGWASGVFWAGPDFEVFQAEDGFAFIEGPRDGGFPESELKSILEAFRRDAPDSPPGERASVLWDGRGGEEEGGGKILLARDRLGIFSLYHREMDGTLYFSNRLAPLVRMPGPRPVPSAAALDHYLTFLHPPADSTWFQGIGKLAPGQRLLWSPGKAPEVRTPEHADADETFRSGFGRAAEAVRGLLETSVARVARRPGRPGLLFSGGTDSTALLLLLREAMGDFPVTLTVAAVGNPDLEFARRFVESRGIENVRILLRPEDLAETWDDVIAAMDEPLGNSSSLATFQAARAVSGRVDTLVSGIGSDEIFAGHRKHVLAHWTPLVKRLQGIPGTRAVLNLLLRRTRAPDTLARFAGGLQAGKPPREVYRTLYHHLEEDRRGSLLSPRAREALADMGNGREERGPEVPWERESFFRQVGRIDVEDWLSGDLLPTFAAAARPAGLKGAFPFCDARLMALAASLPFGWKVRGWEGKRVLKRALAPVLPPEILKRGRQGFTQPLGRWFREAWRDKARERLLDGAAGSGLLDPEAVRSLWEDHQSERRNFGYILWALIVLLGWCERYPEARL